LNPINNNDNKSQIRYHRRTAKKIFNKFMKKRQTVINRMKEFSKINKLPINIKKKIANMVYQMEFINNSNNDNDNNNSNK
jgi:phenylacetate-coenzyme A ligase PaaK-like adenylate-forming protein